jgi:hypothetical protein
MLIQTCASLAEVSFCPHLVALAALVTAAPSAALREASAAAREASRAVTFAVRSAEDEAAVAVASTAAAAAAASAAAACPSASAAAAPAAASDQGLTLLHFSARRKHITLGTWFPPLLLDRGTRGDVTKTAQVELKSGRV